MTTSTATDDISMYKAVCDPIDEVKLAAKRARERRISLALDAIERLSKHIEHDADSLSVHCIGFNTGDMPGFETRAEEALDGALRALGVAQARVVEARFTLAAKR